MTRFIERINEVARTGPEFTLLVTVVLLATGLLILGLARHHEHLPDLGIGLVVGALFGFASYTNQVTVSTADFKNTLAVTHDLSGFSANGQHLDGLSFASKIMTGAQLGGEDLHGANFKYAVLREATLRDANMHSTNLFYATFLRADLQDADLRTADLRGAKVSTPDFSGARLQGAQVNASTCWNITFDTTNTSIPVPDPSGAKVLARVVKGGLRPADGQTLGRACYKREVGSAQAANTWPHTRPVFVCVGEPHLNFSGCSR